MAYLFDDIDSDTLLVSKMILEGKDSETIAKLRKQVKDLKGEVKDLKTTGKTDKHAEDEDDDKDDKKSAKGKEDKKSPPKKGDKKEEKKEDKKDDKKSPPKKEKKDKDDEQSSRSGSKASGKKDNDSKPEKGSSSKKGEKSERDDSKGGSGSSKEDTKDKIRKKQSDSQPDDKDTEDSNGDDSEGGTQDSEAPGGDESEDGGDSSRDGGPEDDESTGNSDDEDTGAPPDDGEENLPNQEDPIDGHNKTPIDLQPVLNRGLDDGLIGEEVMIIEDDKYGLGRVLQVYENSILMKFEHGIEVLDEKHIGYNKLKAATTNHKGARKAKKLALQKKPMSEDPFVARIVGKVLQETQYSGTQGLDKFSKDAAKKGASVYVDQDVTGDTQDVAVKGNKTVGVYRPTKKGSTNWQGYLQ